MATFLQIVGILFLVLLLIIVGGILYIRAKIRQFGKALAGAMPTPAEITLKRAEDESWTHPAVVESVAGFEKLGYVRGAAYGVEEMEHLIVLPLVNGALNAYGIVYNMNDGGTVWSDVVQRYEDGSVTISNSTHTKGLKQRPGYENTYFPGEPVGELHRQFLEKRRPQGALPASFEGFKAEFEEAYASEMAWRDATGVSAEEISAIAQGSNMDLTEEELRLAEIEVARGANLRLVERLQAEFLRTTTMGAAEWKDVEDRLAFVHDRLTADELQELAAMAYEDEEEDVEVTLPAGTPRESFALYNATLPVSRRFELLGTVTSSVEADVYAAPASVYAD